jgi:hypothetical protein
LLVKRPRGWVEVNQFDVSKSARDWGVRVKRYIGSQRFAPGRIRVS